MQQTEIKCNRHRESLIEYICFHDACKDCKLFCLKCLQNGDHASHIYDIKKNYELPFYIKSEQKKGENYIHQIQSLINESQELLDNIKASIRQKYVIAKNNLHIYQSEFISKAIENIILFNKEKEDLFTQLSSTFLVLNDQLKLCDQNLKLQISNVYMEFFKNGIFFIHEKVQIPVTDKALEIIHDYLELFSITLHTAGKQQELSKPATIIRLERRRTLEFYVFEKQGKIIRVFENQEAAIKWLTLAFPNEMDLLSSSAIGYVLSLEEKYDESLKYIDRALKIHPYDYFSLTVKSYCLFKQNNYKEALSAVDQALTQNANYLLQKHDKDTILLQDCHLLQLPVICTSLAIKQLYDEAYILSKMILKYRPDDAQMIAIKCYCLAMKQQYQEAFLTIRNHESGFLQRMIERYCLLMTQQFQEVLWYYDRLNFNDFLNFSHFQTEDIRAFFQWFFRSTSSYCLAMEGEQEEALKQINSCKLDTQHPLSLIINSYCLAIKGQYEDSHQMMSKLQTCYQKDALLVSTRSYCLAMKGFFKEAIDLIEQNFEKTPNIVFPLSIIIYCLTKQKKYQEAISLIKNVLKTNQSYIVHSMHAQCIYLQNNSKQAQNFEFIDFVLYTQKNFSKLMVYGCCLKQKGKYNEALICFDAVLEMNSRDVKALSFKGEVLLILKKQKEALDCIKKALDIDPSDKFSLKLKKKAEGCTIM